MMQRVLYFAFFLVLVGGTFFVFSVLIEKSFSQNNTSVPIALVKSADLSDVIEYFPFDWQLFSVGLARYEQEKKLQNAVSVESLSKQKASKQSESHEGNSVAPKLQRIGGGVVPHHLLATTIIADFYDRLRAQKPKTIVIIGPDHEGVASEWAVTTTKSWRVAGALVKPDTTVIEKLITEKVLSEDSKVVESEHSVTTQIPFIHHFLPETTVVPIVVSEFASLEKINTLAKALSAMDSSMVIVGSVDFSHNLTALMAEKKDDEMEKLLAERNYEKLLSLAGNSQYLDSVPSLLVVMKAMELRREDSMHILQNTNSGFLLKKMDVPTTSYFEITFSGANN